MNAIWAAITQSYRNLRAIIAKYLANDDPLAAAANAGAFLVWSNQPFYPLYVWFLVGKDAWPALLTWISTPLFFSVPLVARRSGLAGRALFVVVGVVNTLVSLKAFGTEEGIGWFLVPCLILAFGFFRLPEWPVTIALCGLVALAWFGLDHLGAPLQTYAVEQNRSLSHLNLWSAAVLSLYLVYAAVRARRAS